MRALTSFRFCYSVPKGIGFVFAKKCSGLFSLVVFCLGVPSLAWGAKTLEAQILEDRVGMYEKLSGRLRAEGPNASFPEFKPVVKRLIADLEADWFLSVVQANPVLQFEVEEVRTLLFHVNIEFTYEDKSLYPYQVPFGGIFPYRPTIDAIERAVALFDKVDRLSNPQEAVDLYHFDRYAYHRHRMMSDPRVVVIPTFEALGFNELIQVRSVPIGFIGVSTRGLRVDRHYQTPLDFWYHDLNHVRRMVEYLFKVLREINPNMTFADELEVYRRMDDFISKTLMPHLEKIPLAADREKFAKRAMLRVLVFEILHESALPADRQWIIDDLLRRPGITQPFEVMLEARPDSSFNQETLRTATGNLRSGSRAFRERGSESVVIHGIHDRALALLANVYNKLKYGFFDAPEDPKNYVVPPEYRTPEAILEAAKELFRILEYNEYPDDGTLLGWIRAKAGSPEKFTYDSIRSNGEDPSPGSPGSPRTVSETLGAQAAIAHITLTKGNKRVVTFMGNSINEYEDYNVVDEILLEKLRSLNPATDIVNSGATKEGISRVYRLARALGFETMGIVPTQALAYSGRFHPDVDHLVIVDDSRWGGRDSDGKLTPVTEVFVTVSDEVFAVGGGENTAVTIEAFEALGKPLFYRAAEVNREAARREALYKKRPSPTTFEGAAFRTWKKIAADRVAKMENALLCSQRLVKESASDLSP